MLFKVGSDHIPRPGEERNLFFLYHTDWNDWFRFRTLFFLYYFDQNGDKHEIGSVKIASFNMGRRGATILDPEFDTLSDEFFSVGQDESYYADLNALGDETRDKILNALNDVAKNETLLARALPEDVMQQSLLRDVTAYTVQGQFRRLTIGGEVLTPYDFSYLPPSAEDVSAALDFKVYPTSTPPTNIHVLIGRNGVGKTRLLTNMIKALIRPEELIEDFGSFTSDETTSFANLVLVNFSAFDTSAPLPETENPHGPIKYSYVGLRQADVKNPDSITTKTPSMLCDEFVESMQKCTGSRTRIKRWERAVEALEADPHFKEASFTGVINILDEGERKKKASKLYGELSSGHKIVLLTISKLVETVEEKTLVLIDEPEAHLHPPLLSALVRAVSDLLIDRNGVAIIATHSPVVLQEVPKSCVWKLRKVGEARVAERLEIESFGENVGVLTREVFQLEVIQSGFHKILSNAVDDRGNYEQVLYDFDGQLGMEARGILRVLFFEKDKDDF
jgi:predicted ATPase